VRTLFWIVGLVAVWTALTVAVNLPRDRRLRKLAASRSGGDAFAAFRESLPAIPEAVLRSVYSGVQNVVPGEDFPLRADDDLLETLEVDLGDLSDLMEDILAQKPGAVSPSDAGSPIETVGDLARAVWANQQREND
jgi:hypothetical protein